jgi:hypothetical protein
MSSNTRIRYNKARNGVLQSRRMFMTRDGQEVKVELDLTAKRYRIVDSVTGMEVASGGNTKNQSVLKIQAKKGLMNLGVEFAEETRPRVILPAGNSTVGAL